MGTLTHIAPVLGLLAGIIIAKLVPYELKQGEKYFRALQYALVTTIIGMAVWQRVNNQAINLDIPAFLLLIPVGTLHHKKHLLLTGIAAVYIIIASLVF